MNKIIDISTDEALIKSLQKQVLDVIKASGVLNKPVNDNHIGGPQIAVYALHQVAADLKGHDEFGRQFIDEALSEVLTHYQPVMV